MISATSYASVHSLVRAKERMGYNSKSAKKKILRAIERGKSYNSFTSWEKNSLKEQCRGDCRAVAYDGFCYILSECDSCISMFPLPSWFGKKKFFDGKEKINNAKAYSRYYDRYENC